MSKKFLVMMSVDVECEIHASSEEEAIDKSVQSIESHESVSVTHTDNINVEEE